MIWKILAIIGWAIILIIISYSAGKEACKKGKK